MLSVVPQSMHIRATSPGSPPNGAISATLDIGRPHRLQALCAITFIVLAIVVGPSLFAMRVKKWGMISFQFCILDFFLPPGPVERRGHASPICANLVWRIVELL
jgi:nitrate reductase NapE component